jgi:DNA-binding Lrp family transcriptional regulator
MGMAAVHLNLRPASVAKVFWAVFLTWCRYGQKEARLEISTLAEMTGLGKRTAQAAISELLDRGLIVRVGRYSRFRIVLPQVDLSTGDRGNPIETETSSAVPGSANKLAHRTRSQACASPTVNMFSSLIENSREAFTAKQLAVVTDVAHEASELLGHDVGGLTVNEKYITAFGITSASTYADALRRVVAEKSPVMARDFTKAMLALRDDDRVQGVELTHTG